MISGEDEGVYGWIAVNYLNGHLAPAKLPAPVVLQVGHSMREDAASADSTPCAARMWRLTFRISCLEDS